MDPQKELEHLREKVALLEKCVEYERLLREMRDAAPREPVTTPGPYEVRFLPWQPWVWPDTTCDPHRYYWDTVTVC